MTITLPTQYGAQLTNDWLGLSEIRALEWDDLIAAGHLVYDRLVSHMGGHCFEPTWLQSATSLTYQSESTSRDLDEIGLGGFAEREMAGGDVELVIATIAEHTTFRLTITNLAQSAQLLQDNFAIGAFGLATYRATLTRSDVVDGSGRPEHLDIDIEAQADGSGDPARIWQLRAGELETKTASDLPTG